MMPMATVAPLSAGRTEQHIHFIVRVHQAHMTYQHLLAIWQAADSLGYDGASLYDLLAAPCLECWTTLTMLTTATRRIRAVPMVLAHTYRHPAMLAKMAATLDMASEGRLVLGLGAGGSKRDHEASGIPWRPLQERLAQLEEGIQLLRFLWSGQDGPFASRSYGRVKGPGFPQPYQRGGPPILVGGHGERYVLRTVARVADLCNIGFDLSPAQWQRYQETLARAADEEGRPPAAIGLTHNATVLLGTSVEMIRTQVECYAQAQRLSTAAARQRLAHALVGTPEQCIARLQAYVTLGIRTFFLVFPDLPNLASLQLFAATVLPAFHSRGP
jgi:alkanesulfonate monooxygenase SsuD/methylene tetrahydromethanopterin reductase-like flavin-dependent oxidoreductase (luciferase family)